MPPQDIILASQWRGIKDAVGCKARLETVPGCLGVAPALFAGVLTGGVLWEGFQGLVQADQRLFKGGRGRLHAWRRFGR